MSKSLNNFLDKEFQEMLFPLNLMQSVLLQPKYRILHGFVTSNGLCGQIKGILGVIFITIVYFVKMWIYKLNSKTEQKDLAVAFGIFDTVFYGVFSSVTFAVNVAQGKNNVQFILKMQQAYRLFNNNESLRDFRKYNWRNIGITLLTCFAFVISNYIRSPDDYAQILSVLSLFYFDGNIIFAIQSVKFLEREVKLWLSKLNDFLVLCSEPNHNELTKYLNVVNHQETKLYAAYLDILEAFKLYKCVFQYSILLLAIEVFVHPLMYIQTLLSLSQSETCDNCTLTLFYALVPSLWVVKNYVLLIVLSVVCQQFNLAIGEVDKTCAIMCGHVDNLYIVDVQKLCKNVLRVNACSVGGRGLRAGGALAVDAALPLRLLALLATYTVVLLQFALLSK